MIILKCPNCNSEINDKSQFCTYCGSKVHLRTIADLTKNAIAQSDANEERPERDPDASKTVYTPYTTHASNTKRCKICGGEIDPVTKVCMNCQKSYANSFRMGRSDKTDRAGKAGYIVALSITAVLLIVSGVFAVIKNNELNDAYARIDTLQTRVSSLETRVNDYQDKASFVDEYIAIVVEGDDRYYHTYDCKAYQQCEYFWIYGINDAEYYGYEPCPECH